MLISLAADELTGVAAELDAAVRERGHDTVLHGALATAPTTFKSRTLDD